MEYSKSYHVLKVGDLYLEDVWEDFNNEENYCFTENLSEAMPFYRLDEFSSAPKYLYDYKNNKSINTINEMCEFFNGKMVEVSKTIIWKEI